VPVRVESLADRIDFGQPDLFKAASSCFSVICTPSRSFSGSGRARFERAFQAVGDRNQRLGERLDRVLWTFATSSAARRRAFSSSARARRYRS